MSERGYGSASEARSSAESRDMELARLANLERQAFVLELEAIGQGEGVAGFDFQMISETTVWIWIRWEGARREVQNMEGIVISGYLIEQELSEEERRLDEEIKKAQASAEGALARLIRFDPEAAIEAAGKDSLGPIEDFLDSWTGSCKAASAEAIARSFGWEEVACRIEAERIGEAAGREGAERRRSAL